MIRFKLQSDTQEIGGINMMPLIDIIFNLLIFFLITATISTKGINLDLPKADSSAAVPTKTREIVINEQGEIYFAEVRISLNRLETILMAERHKADQDRIETIVVKAHQEVPFGTFIAVMDTARKTGFYNLVIATDPKLDAL